MTIQQAFDQAIQFYGSSNFSEAEKICRQILAASPEQPDANYLLGMIAGALNRPDVAIQYVSSALKTHPNVPHWLATLGEFYRRCAKLPEATESILASLKIDPNQPDTHNYYGHVLRDSGQLNDAISEYRQAIALAPKVAVYRNSLGIALRQAGQTEEAIAVFREAIVLQPNYADAHNNLGNALRSAGRLPEAITAYQQAISFNPNLTEAHANLGNALADLREFDDAVKSYLRTLAINPSHLDTLVRLGSVLRLQGKFDDATTCFQAVLAQQPSNSPAQVGIGNVLGDQKQFNRACDAFRKAIELDPNNAEAHSNLSIALSVIGDCETSAAEARRAIEINPRSSAAYNAFANALARLGKYAESTSAYRKAIELDPKFPDAHWNLALNLLLEGDFKTGWQELEWREQSTAAGRPLQHSKPKWTGEPLNGKRILLHTEQGLGDTIQFIRYAPRVAEAGGNILLHCPQELWSLLEGVDGINEVWKRPNAPEFDVHCPLMSLPNIFQTQIDTVPANVPYIRPKPDAVDVWRTKLPKTDARLRVGVVWAGNPKHRRDHERSIDLQEFAHLARPGQIDFWSLQKGKENSAGIANDLPLIDRTNELHDFSDTAALIANLDLVISVDTAVAHLAGAMGKTVWVLLPFVPDWRWMLGRVDSPWYPSMRLFRQQIAGDWEAPLRAVEAELDKLLAE